MPLTMVQNRDILAFLVTNFKDISTFRTASSLLKATDNYLWHWGVEVLCIVDIVFAAEIDACSQSRYIP